MSTLLVAAFAVVATTAQAAIIAKTSYNDMAGGLNTNDGGPDDVGFSADWVANSANLIAEAGGILDGDPTSGQGKFNSAPGEFSDFYRRADRTLNPVGAPPASTYYMSHLVNAGSSTGPNQEYAFVGYGGFVAQDTIEGVANNLLGAFTGFVGNGTGGVDLVIRSRTAPAPGGTSDEVLVTDAINTTYNVVMALEFNNPTDEIRYWVDPTDFGNGEAGLDATAVTSGTIGGFQLSAPSDFARLSVITNAFDRSFFWDESILADSVADLNPIPEPSALVLALGALGVVARRRR